MTSTYFMDGPGPPTNIFVATVGETISEKQLTFDGRSRLPIWSPGGTRIAFIDGSGVAVIDADDTNRKELASFKLIRDLSWSPDGRALAVSGVVDWKSQQIGRMAIYILDPNSAGTPRALVENGSSPAWSPDGTQIAYTCPKEVKPGEYFNSICITPVTAERQPRVVMENAWDPSWSPTGENIAYLTRASGKGLLSICHPDGSNVIGLTDHKRDVPAYLGRSYAWSPDGDRIAYLQELPRRGELITPQDAPRVFVARTNGTREGPLGQKDHIRCNSKLSWSTDGKLIAAICTREGRDRFGASLFLLDPNDLNSRPRLVAEHGIVDALFSPR